MSWTQSDTGTTTLTGGGTEDVLVSGDTNVGTFVFNADLTNMVNGDIIECRIYKKVLTGGSLREVWKASWSNVQIEPAKLSIPVESLFSIKVTMTQQAGTGRSVDWSLDRI